MPKKTSKKKSKKTPKHRTLVPKFNSRIRQEYLDYDYIDQLSEKEKEFLDKFNSEYYLAKVGKQADKGKHNKFIKGKQNVKDIQTNNNKRNSDLYGNVRNKVGATKLLNYDDVLNIVENKISNADCQSIEDAMIDYLDYVKITSNRTKKGSKDT